MGQPEIHDLAAAYALDALDPEDRWTYERHLDNCEHCRDEVARLRAGAVQIAYAATGPEPRPELRDRILRAAREERPASVTPLRRRRWLFPATALAAAAATFAAVGLGLWANSLRNDVDGQRVVAMQGGGRLVISGDEASILACLDRAPGQKTYEAWVIENKVPRPAGLFRGGCGTLRLTQPVKRGNTVAVTLEAEGGSNVPKGEILMSANV